MPRITKLYGPPGTGKTTWMLNQLDKELTAGTQLNRIAYVTFSVAAREEAKTRARGRFIAANEHFKYFKTIHGICYAEAHLSGLHVMQTADFLDFGKKNGIKFSDDYTEDFDIDGNPFGWSTSRGNSVLNIRQVASARLVDPMSDACRLLDWPRDISAQEVRHVLENYKVYKQTYTKFDFVDMLLMYADVGDPLPIDVMFIDEAQDLSSFQWKIVEKMWSGSQRVYLAGDDDQSIYGFLGADPAGFFHYQCDEKIVLHKSYRLRKNIWNYANRIISNVAEREPKTVQVRAEGGVIENWNRPAEEVLARTAGKGEVMVISSTNHQLASMATRMENNGIPVTFKGRSAAGGKHAFDVYSYHQARTGASIGVRQAASLLRLIGSTAAKTVSEEARQSPEAEVTKEQLEAYGVNFNAPWLQYLSKDGYHKRLNEKLRQIAQQGGLDAMISQPKIELTTYHASKGREADTVILVTDCSPSAYDYAIRDPDNERRVAYVGATRAKEKLIILSPQTSENMRAFQ